MCHAIDQQADRLSARGADHNLRLTDRIQLFENFTLQFAHRWNGLDNVIRPRSIIVIRAGGDPRQGAGCVLAAHRVTAYKRVKIALYGGHRLREAIRVSPD